MTFPVLEESADDEYHRTQRRTNRSVSADGIESHGSDWGLVSELRGCVQRLLSAGKRWRRDFRKR